MARIGIIVLTKRYQCYPNWQTSGRNLCEEIANYGVSFTCKNVTIKLKADMLMLDYMYADGIRVGYNKNGNIVISRGTTYVMVRDNNVYGPDDDPSLIQKIKQVQITCYNDLYKYIPIVLNI